MRHIIITDKKGTRSFDINRVASTFYPKNQDCFYIWIKSITGAEIERFDFFFNEGYEAEAEYSRLLEALV